MSDSQPISAGPFSRRRFLQAAAIGGATAIGTGFLSAPAATANKVPQKAVSYQATPKGNLRCDNCLFWQPPASCKLVDGHIDPAGWCSLYRKK